MPISSPTNPKSQTPVFSRQNSPSQGWAGLDGFPVTDTNNDGVDIWNHSDPTNFTPDNIDDLTGTPFTGTRPAAGNWGSLQFTEKSNDRNVKLLFETESANNGAVDTNSNPGHADFREILAPNYKSGDDNRSLGFQLHGSISADSPADVDVYSFEFVIRLQANQLDGSTQFTIVVTDGVHDAPVNTIPTVQTLDEDTSIVFSAANGNAITVSDKDAYLGTNRMQITLQSVNGTITPGSTANLKVPPGATPTLITFEGDIADLNNALNGLTFVLDAACFGPAQIIITTDDQGQFSGPPSLPATTANTVQLMILPVNDQPTFSLRPVAQTIITTSEMRIPGKQLAWKSSSMQIQAVLLTKKCRLLDQVLLHRRLRSMSPQ